ncbi:MAG TPA: hypothetical protein VM784_10070 [Actinomycetota bacterium]|nr:hypothetical protein [Actinomycetota bacterium]
MGTRLACLVVASVIAAACSADEEPRPSSQKLATLWKTKSNEPYPFSGEVPPLRPTPLDGLYVRRVPVADVGRPVPCRRCPPYKIHAGEARLRLERGRYYVDEDGSQFGSEGHFVVDGDEITFFNDPVCQDERVTYRYALDDGALVFEPVRDPCAYQNLRGRYLTTYSWQAE